MVRTTSPLMIQCTINVIILLSFPNIVVNYLAFIQKIIKMMTRFYSSYITILMKQLTQSEFDNAISTGISVVDFFATRCGPCKMIAPYLEEMDEKTGDKVNFFKVDVDQEKGLAASQSIRAMPTLKIFNNGVEVKTIVGADLQGVWDALQAEIAKSASEDDITKMAA